MAPEYGATCGFFPIDDKTLDYMRLTGRPTRTRSRWSRPMPRSRASGSIADGRRSGVHRHARARHGDRRALARRARSGRRTGSRCPTVDEVFNAELTNGLRQGPTQSTALRGRGRRARHRRRRRRDRRDHQLHQHLEPRRAGRRRPGRRARRNARGLKPKPWVKTSLAPGIAGRHRLSRQGRPAATISTRSASTWSAMAAPPASAIRARWPSRSARRSTATTSSPPRCSRATATSRAASRPTCAPTSSPRRRWWSPMRSRAR